ncbi:MAG: signal peptidase I [Ruminococcaceae bacterium]|nr:signal peptidase I [Oscillospiraceae bacterium]
MFDEKQFPEQEPEETTEEMTEELAENESVDEADVTFCEIEEEVVASGFAATHPILKEIVDWIVVLAAALVITFVIRTFVFTMVVVDGPSMENTLKTGDRLAVVRLAYEPKQGDIIVFYPNGNKERPYIKRVIAIEGQTIDVRDGNVYVDGALIEEPYLGSPTTESGNQSYPITLPEGYLFAMGDNRQQSLDCRSTSVGLVDYQDVVGKAWVRLFPFDNRFGSLY